MAFKARHDIPHKGMMFRKDDIVTVADMPGVDFARLVQVGALLPLGTHAEVRTDKPSTDDLMDQIESLHNLSVEQQDSLDKKDREIQGLTSEVENLKGLLLASSTRETNATEDLRIAGERTKTLEETHRRELEKVQGALIAANADLELKRKEFEEHGKLIADLQNQLSEAQKQQKKK